MSHPILSDPSLSLQNSSQQQIMTHPEENPTHLLQKQERNFCPQRDSDHFPVGVIMESEFQRYSKTEENVSSSNIQLKKQSIMNRDNHMVGNRLTNNQPASSTECYIDWKVYKSKPDLSMLPFPYCIDQRPHQKRLPNSPLSLFNPFRPQQNQPSLDLKKSSEPLPKLYSIKIENKVRIYNQKDKQNKVCKPYFNFQKTPINEYLNYELAEEINSGLREVQIMAEEIKRIKKEKKLANQDDLALKEKYSKGVRIRRSHVKNYKGIYKTNANI